MFLHVVAVWFLYPHREQLFFCILVLVSLECTGIIVVPSFRCARFVACPVSEWAFHFVGICFQDWLGSRSITYVVVIDI
jgi:hypothetical protein